MRNKQRIKQLEKVRIKDTLIVYVTHILDDTIPVGAYKKIVNGSTSIILSQKEYEEEIRGCKNLIDVGH